MDGKLTGHVHRRSGFGNGFSIITKLVPDFGKGQVAQDEHRLSGDHGFQLIPGGQQIVAPETLQSLGEQASRVRRCGQLGTGALHFKVRWRQDTQLCAQRAGGVCRQRAQVREVSRFGRFRDDQAGCRVLQAKSTRILAADASPNGVYDPLTIYAAPSTCRSLTSFSLLYPEAARGQEPNSRAPPILHPGDANFRRRPVRW